MKRFTSFKCVPIYGLMFRILTRFRALYFGTSCIHRNSIVWRRVDLARFPYWPEKRKRRISRYSYLMKTLISSEYGLTISGHVTMLRQWLSEKNTDYIIMYYIALPSRNFYEFENHPQPSCHKEICSLSMKFNILNLKTHTTQKFNTTQINI